MVVTVLSETGIRAATLRSDRDSSIPITEIRVVGDSTTTHLSQQETLYMHIYRTLITAALAASVSVPAFAKIDDSVTGGALGGSGELFWAVIDQEGERSYTRDLGISLQSFLNGAAADMEWSFAADPKLGEFIAGTAKPSTLVWNIGALDGTGINRYLSTAPAGSALPIFTNQALGFFNDNPDIFLAGTNALESHLSSENGSNIATAADGSAYAAQNWGDRFGGRAGSFSNYIGINESADLVLFRQASTAFAQRNNPGVTEQITNGTLPYVASFEGGVLTISAVPEPTTYAMMGLGLAALGFVARRRNAR
jgi:hypothetical protein